MSGVKVRPVVFVWTDDEVMKPVARFLPMCQRQFVIGEQYPLTLVENRDMRMHRGFMAGVVAAWENLREDVKDRYPTIRTETPDHLRKWALIQVGYADEDRYVFDTAKDARNAARIVRRRDDFAVILVRGSTLQVFTAKSQAVGAMATPEFKDSARKVERLLEEVNGVDRGAYRKAASA